MSVLKHIWDIINEYSGALGLVLTVAGFLAITRNQLISERFENRLNNMKKTMEVLSGDRNMFMEAGLGIYKHRYRNKKDCSEFVKGGHLVYKDGWVNNKMPDGSFWPLSKFTPRITSSYASTQYDIPYNPRLPDRRESYADNCKFHLGKNLFNAPLYALESVKVADGIQPEITVALGSYFDFYNTCEYLGFEMAYARRILGKKEQNKRTLPVRYRNIDIFDTSNRFPGIGIDVITILHNVIDDTQAGEQETKRSYFLLHKRGNKVAEGMGNYHVIPAGSYQPLREYIEREDTDSDNIAETMKNTVLREFGEELLDYEEFLDLNTSDLLQRLDQILEPVYLGIGFEPLNTKTEVLAALIIDLDRESDRKLFNGRRKLSEFNELFGGNQNYEGDIFLRPLTTAMLKQYENDGRSTASMKEIMRILSMEKNKELFGVIESARYVYEEN